MNSELKDMLSMIINAILYWVLWFVLGNLLSFLGWAYSYHSLDFNHWRWHNDVEGSLGWGIFSVLISFPLSFFIIRKLNIKL